MSFLGIGFLVGLAGILLPVAIHIFGKRKKVIQQWGAMRFLEQATPNWKRRALRIQDLIVLLLRIGAVALLAIAFAQPALKLPLPPTDVHELILIVDRSPSTELGAETNDLVADKITDQTAEFLAKVPAETRIRFFVNGSGPGMLNLPPQNGKPFNSTRNRAAWVKALSSLPVGDDTVDWSEAVRDVLTRSDLPAPLSREVLIIADAAKHGWPEIDSWQSIETETPVSIVPVGARHPHRKRANLTVDRLVTDQKRVQSGRQITFRATVSNRGKAESEECPVRWTESTEDRLLAEDSIPKLAPGEVHETILKRAFPEAGPMSIQINLDPAEDALSTDNSATKPIEVIDRIKVAVVIDVPPDSLDDAGDRFAAWTFAAAAGDPGSIAFGEHAVPVPISKTGQSDPLFQLEWLTPDRISEIDLDQFSIIVWAVADSSQLSRQFLNTYLRPFVSEGGGLWLNPPFDVDTASFNEKFFPHEYGLSPAGLAPAHRIAKENNFGLRPVVEDEPNFFGKSALSALEELQANRHLALVAPLPETSSRYLEFAGGRPFVIHRQFKRGQVVLTTLDTDPKSGNLAACLGYVPFIRELLWNLADPEALPQELRVAAESETTAITRSELDRINDIENLNVLDPDTGTGLPGFIKRFDRTEPVDKNYELKEIQTWILIGLLGFLVLEVLMAHHLLSRRRRSVSGQS